MIIVVGPDYEKDNAASYQYEFMNLIQISENIFIILKVARLIWGSN